MFEFTTQTVYNAIVKTTDTAIKEGSAPKGYNLVTSEKSPAVRIGNTRFNPEDVLDIQVKNPTVENLASVTFDIANLITLVEQDGKDTKEGNYRVVLYIGLSMNSQHSLYANDFVYKGKPLFIEFPIGANDEAEAVAAKIKKIADKYLLFQFLEKILTVKVDGTNVTFEGVNGYQLIRKAILLKYDPNASQIDCCNNNGDFIDIITGVPVTYTTDAEGVVTTTEEVLDADGKRELADNEVAIAPGIEAFGDYNWMIHNLRLPTLANTYFWSPTKDEMPVVGGTYTQFIIRMLKDRDGIAGEVVGQRAHSLTNHVLYVLNAGTNVLDVTTAITPLASSIKTDADTALQDPFAGAED